MSQNPPSSLSKDREPSQDENLHDQSTDPGNRTMNTDTWPKYLVIEATDKDNPINSLNLFIRAKALHAILGIEPKDVIFYRNSGILCVEVTTRTQSNSLLQATMLHTVPIKVSPHRTKNYTKGVFTCHDLVGMTDEDILNEIRDQDVVEIHRITSKRSNAEIPTSTFITTFNATVLPRSIKIGYLNAKIRPYIPNPRRCFNCQQYGHSKLRCQHTPVCAKCGQEGHEFETCTNNAHCLHCGANHPASSKECPKWKSEKKIMELVTSEKITFFEARQRVTPIINHQKLMSDVVRNTPVVQLKSVATQTTGTHCLSCSCQSRHDANIQTNDNLNESMDEESSSKRRKSDSDEGDAPPSKTKPSAAIAASSSLGGAEGQSRSGSPSSVRSRSKSPRASRPKIIRPPRGESNKDPPPKSNQQKPTGIPQRATKFTAKKSR